MEKKEGQEPAKSSQKQTTPNFRWALFVNLGVEFAVVIALPLIIFIFLGSILGFLGLHGAAAWANEHKDKSSAYKLLGLLIAMTISFYGIYRKIKEVDRMLKNN